MLSHACVMLFNLPNCLGVGARDTHSTLKLRLNLEKSEDLPDSSGWEMAQLPDQLVAQDKKDGAV